MSRFDPANEQGIYLNAKLTVMLEKHFNLFDIKTPLVFTDGTEVYSKLREVYTTHKVGYFIMAPSGAGKTHFIKSQPEMHWLDGDELWMATNAHPDGAWWNEPIETIIEIDSRCDVITQEAKKLGFWILGASNNWLPPDAIVLPDWETHKKWIAHREQTNYDGGATSDKLDQVQNHRAWIAEWEAKGVPKFETVEAAASFLASQSVSQKA